MQLCLTYRYHSRSYVSGNLSNVIADLFHIQSNSGTKAKQDLAEATRAVEVRQHLLEIKNIGS